MHQFELTDQQFLKAEQQAALRGFPTVSDYVVSLLEQDEPTASAQQISTIAQLEAALTEGLTSKSADLTQQDWLELKRRVLEVHAAGV
jgi:hypothetical protein